MTEENYHDQNSLSDTPALRALLSEISNNFGNYFNVISNFRMKPYLVCHYVWSEPNCCNALLKIPSPEVNSDFGVSILSAIMDEMASRAFSL